jgi:hypothetical protein
MRGVSGGAAARLAAPRSTQRARRAARSGGGTRRLPHCLAARSRAARRRLAPGVLLLDARSATPRCGVRLAHNALPYVAQPRAPAAAGSVRRDMPRTDDRRAAASTILVAHTGFSERESRLRHVHARACVGLLRSVSGVVCTLIPARVSRPDGAARSRTFARAGASSVASGARPRALRRRTAGARGRTGAKKLSCGARAALTCDRACTVSAPPAAAALRVPR